MADKDDPAPGVMSKAQAGLRIAEDVVYIGVSLLLVAAALVLLVQAAITLATTASKDGIQEAVKATLDLLLFVFIVVELLGAVRTTVRERKLVAEPFLIVGMIASIKEIIVIAISAKDSFGAPDGAFEDAMLEIAVLGGLVVGLAVAMFLSRLKEREPEE